MTVKYTPTFNIDSVYFSLRKNSLGDSSIRLTAAAKLGYSAEYRQDLADMISHLASSSDGSFKAWMLGRVALAASAMDDKSAVRDAVTEIKRVLANAEQNAEYVWALGYLASVNSREYTTYFGVMLQTVKQIKKPADALWAYVMAMQAAAAQRDLSAFDSIQDHIRERADKRTVSDALSTIPKCDWQAWALAIALKSAALMRNEGLFDELLVPTQQAINDALASNSMANALLAELEMGSAISIDRTMMQFVDPAHQGKIAVGHGPRQIIDTATAEAEKLGLAHDG